MFIGEISGTLSMESIGSGTFRNVYLAQFRHLAGEYFAAKEYKDQHISRFNKSYSALDKFQQTEMVMQDAISQRTAALLADAFTAQLKSRFDANANLMNTLALVNITYLIPQILESVESQFKKTRIFSVEKVLPHKNLPSPINDMHIKFQKFNTNKTSLKTAAKDKEIITNSAVGRAAQAFSHASYVYTFGHVMVVDLQGVVNGDRLTLTDPQLVIVLICIISTIYCYYYYYIIIIIICVVVICIIIIIMLFCLHHHLVQVSVWAVINTFVLRE